MMECGNCNNDVSDCTCEDLETRLDNSGLAYKRCRICMKHYERCGCVAPDWFVSSNGIEDHQIIMSQEQIDELGGRHPDKIKQRGG